MPPGVGGEAQGRQETLAGDRGPTVGRGDDHRRRHKALCEHPGGLRLSIGDLRDEWAEGHHRAPGQGREEGDQPGDVHPLPLAPRARHDPSADDAERGRDGGDLDGGGEPLGNCAGPLGSGTESQRDPLIAR